MDPSTVTDMFKQIISGEDIPKIHTLLKRLNPEVAAKKLGGWPYSILTNLAHADHWQRIWLARIEGAKRPKFPEDWRIPDPSEFEELRTSFLSGLDRCLAITRSDEFAHHMKSDDAALHTLISTAIHNAYHIGQIKLMAQILGNEDDED